MADMSEVSSMMDTAGNTDPDTDTVNRYLFVTETCPNCRIAKGFLEGVDYRVINAADHPELTEKYGIRQAPTLIVQDESGTHRFANPSNIKKYVDRLAG